jgi:cysteine-rich repeat protein
MKFHQGLASLLTLLVPFAAADGCNRTVTEWGVDLTPCWPKLKGKFDDDGQRRDRTLEQIQHLPADRRQLFSQADFCDGNPITRTVLCGGEDVIELELLEATTYTIDVQRVDCELLDPASFLFAPGDPLITSGRNPGVANDDDSAPENLPAFCDGDRRHDFFGDPLIKYSTSVGHAGIYKLLTASATSESGSGAVPACPSPNDRVLEYRVFISCSNCGDNVIRDPEECDVDGISNRLSLDDDFDGIDCSASCRLPFCGDGKIESSTEQCDDGNTQSGDGCSATCQIEAPSGSPNIAPTRAPAQLVNDAPSDITYDSTTAAAATRAAAVGLIPGGLPIGAQQAFANVAGDPPNAFTTSSDNALNSNAAAAATLGAFVGLIPGGLATPPPGAQQSLANVAGDPPNAFTTSADNALNFIIQGGNRNLRVRN